MKKLLSSNRKKTILITGGNGFIGSHINRCFKDRYHLVNVVYGNEGTSVANSIALDLRNIKKCVAYFTSFKNGHSVFAIAHLSSLLVSKENAHDTQVLIDNIAITKSLIKIAEILKPEKVIHFSSIALYPNKDGRYSEKSEVAPQENSECLYGISKFCAESLIDFFLKRLGITVTHLRLAQVYGKGMRNDRIIPMMREELEDKNTIHVYGCGIRESNFVPVSRVLRALEHVVNHTRPGTFNVTGCQLSYLALAKKIIETYGNKKSRIIKVRSGVRAKVYIDGTKIERFIGKAPQALLLKELC